MRITEITAYHGSQPRDTTGFALSHRGVNSHTFGEYESDRHGVFFTTNPEFAKLYGDVEQYELMVTNTIDLDDRNTDFADFVDQLMDQDRNLGLEARDVLQYGKGKVWATFEDELGKHFVEYLLGQGYDSARFTEYNEDDEGRELESETIVVLEPNKIVKNKQLQLDI